MQHENSLKKRRFRRLAVQKAQTIPVFEQEDREDDWNLGVLLVEAGSPPAGLYFEFVPS